MVVKSIKEIIIMKNVKDLKTVENIRAEYEVREASKVEKLKALDKKVRRPADVFAYVFGSASALVFGTGMCLAMKVIGASLHPAVGIAVGIAGLGLMGLNYLIYKVSLKRRKAKYADEILALCDDALNEN